MGKRVLILSSSPRKDGNSDTLCHSFASGAKNKGHEVSEIFINKKILISARLVHTANNIMENVLSMMIWQK